MRQLFLEQQYYNNHSYGSGKPTNRESPSEPSPKIIIAFYFSVLIVWVIPILDFLDML